MIGRLKGILATVEPDRVLVETSGGVGYEVLVPPRVLTELPVRGESVTLHIHTHVREDAIVLFGFLGADDRQAFRVVQGVTGIGPKLALAIVGTISSDQLADAIGREDVTALSKIPGLGKKTAARLCLELRDKLGAFAVGGVAGAVPPGRPGQPEAVGDAEAALAALGYNGREIKRALAAAAPKADDTVQSLLRRALKSLSPA